MSGAAVAADAAAPDAPAAPVVVVGAYAHHVSPGSVFTWGDTHGPLGHQQVDGDGDCLFPVRLIELAKIPIVWLAAGSHAAGAISADGTLWTWGSGPSTGHGSDADCLRPRPVSFFHSLGVAVTDVAFGDDGEAGAVAGQEGSVYMWGKGSQGVLAGPAGSPARESRHSPALACVIRNVRHTSKCHSLDLTSFTWCFVCMCVCVYVCVCV
jgi:hypothetical protein